LVIGLRQSSRGNFLQRSAFGALLLLACGARWILTRRHSQRVDPNACSLPPSLRSVAVMTKPDHT
jgi:hypothetical protein